MVSSRIAAFTALLFSFLPAVVLAGNHEIIHPTRGYSIGWENSGEIPYWMDQGGLGFLSNDQAKALTVRMMQVWEGVETANVGFVNRGNLPHDVTGKNIIDYILATGCGGSKDPDIPDNVVPIVFDSDGGAVESLMGLGSSGELGGLATLRCFTGTADDPGAIYQGMIIINGKFIDGVSDDDSPLDLSVNGIGGVILHELGHLIGLDHSVVNDEIFDEISAENRSVDDSKFLPVMLPTVLRNSNSSTTLHPDDIASVSTLYPAEGYLESVGSIKGQILNSDGLEVRKINVVARNAGDPLCEAYSTVSGRRCVPLVDVTGSANFNSTTCGSADKVGDYEIEGVPDGEYTVEVEEFSSGWIRSGMFPTNLDQDMPGDAEFYNWKDESNEDSMKYSLVPVTPAFAAERINFMLSDNISKIDQLVRVPLNVFEDGPSTRCKQDPADYDEMLSDPDFDVGSFVGPLFEYTDEVQDGEAKAGCQMQEAAVFDMFSMSLLILLGLFMAARGKAWEKKS